jgi:hypothetical protein
VDFSLTCDLHFMIVISMMVGLTRFFDPLIDDDAPLRWSFEGHFDASITLYGGCCTHDDECWVM